METASVISFHPEHSFILTMLWAQHTSTELSASSTSPDSDNFIRSHAVNPRHAGLRNHCLNQDRQDYQNKQDEKRLRLQFPVVLYSGDNKWTAPIQFRNLIVPTSVPKMYLPDFRYYKIAINEIPKDHLLRIKNTGSAIFFVENSNPEELAGSIQNLVELIKAENFEVLRLFSEWLEPGIAGSILTLSTFMRWPLAS